jgi:hypothetical protein
VTVIAAVVSVRLVTTLAMVSGVEVGVLEDATGEETTIVACACAGFAVPRSTMTFAV